MDIFLSLLNFLLNYTCFNGPFPSSLEPLFQSEAKCKAVEMKIIFILMHIKLFRFCTQPCFEVRVVETLKWPTAGLFLTSSNFKIKIFRFSELFVLSDIRTTQDYLSLQKFSVSLFCKPCTLGDDLYAGSPKLSTGLLLFTH